MFGDPALLDTILGEIPGMDTMDSDQSEDSEEWGETDDSGAGGGEYFEAEDDGETDVTGEEGDTEEDWEDEHEGVTVEETDYNEAVENSECYGPGDGSFVTSTGVKRNPVRSASFLGFSPTALGSTFTCSPVAEVRREAGESQVSEMSGILMASILF